jgi:GNAT superfamily N-acetyltransferase
LKSKIAAQEKDLVVLRGNNETLSKAIDSQNKAIQNLQDAAAAALKEHQAELDAAELAVGLNTDGTYTAPAGTYVGGTTSVKTGLAALDTGLTTEVADRTAAVAAVASALANEAQLRANGDAALQTQIQDWVNTQIALDNTTDEARVAAEAALRIAKDDALQAEIDRVEAAVGLNTDGNVIPISGTNYLDGVTTVFGGAFALDTQLKVVTDGLASEVSARQAADTTINASIDAETQARTDAEFAILVRSDLKGLGLGKLMMEKIVRYARERGIGQLSGMTMPSNRGMINLAKRLGFKIDIQLEDGIVNMELPCADQVV